MTKLSDSAILWILKLSGFFHYFMPLIPVITLVYMGKGVSVADFFLIQGIFRLAAFLFEIPSGYMADIFSRKKVLLLAALVHFMSMAWLIFAQGFIGVLLCEAGLGLASALFSGTKEAYTYDFLKKIKKEKDYVKINGEIRSFCQVGSFVAVLVGGWLFSIGQYWLLGGGALASFVAFTLYSMLPEMKEVRRKVVPEKSPLKDCLGIVKMSVQHPEIKWLMIFPAVYSGFTIVLLWLFQPVMGLTLVPVALFGIFIGLNQGFRVLFSKFAYKIIKFFGPQRLLGVFIGALFFAFGLMAFLISADNLPMWLVYLLIAVMVIVPASQTMCGLIFNDYIHTRIESNERGTVLSVTSMFNTGIGALFLIAAKPLLDNLGIFWTVIIFLGFVAILFLPLKKVLKIKKL